MYLKSIEIQGFKSFADRQVFHFDRGISAIVGPNGSGKSNIVDAIRWALGEQSAKSLRGGKMEDVIFSGSGSRKAVGMAKVSLILDNSQRDLPLDQDDVEIQRILHRSGESEYKINRQTCRLKDIHELFMDTGIGRDGFSVIGQGKIDEVLMQHADERRSLIEEAAGISKYKYRKREAQRRLDATHEDMGRLDDLLYELEDRLGPLEDQARKVQAYRTYEKEERALFLADLAKNYTAQKEEFQGLEKSLEKIQGLLKEKKARRLETETSRLACLQQQDDLRHLMEEDQAHILDLTRRQQQTEAQILLEKEKIRQLKKDQEGLEATGAQWQSSLKDQDAALKQAQGKAASQRQAFKDMERQLQDFMDATQKLEASYQQAKENVNQDRDRQFTLFHERAQVNNARSRILQSQDGYAYRQQKQQGRHSDLLDHMEALKTRLQGLTAQKEEATKDLAAVEQSIEVQRQRQDQVQERFQEGQKALAALSNQAQAQRSRLETLKELEESGEGYYAGVRAVLQAQAKGAYQGVRGTLGQLLDMEEEYVTAFDVALGGSSQNIVVENDGQAAEIIAWLKKDRLGRVTFMPMNTVQGSRERKAPKGEGLIGNMADLATYDSDYQALVERVLGRTWLVKDLASARKMAKENRFSYRLVTLEGDLLNPGGTLTGGHQKRQGLLLRRRLDIRQLEESLRETQAQIQANELSLERLEADIQALEQDRAEAEERRQSLRLDVNKLSLQESQAQEAYQKLQGDIRYEEADQKMLAKEMQEAQAKLQAYDQEEAALSQSLEDLEEAIRLGQENIQDLENDLANHRSQKHQYELAHAREAEKMAYEDKQTQQLKDQWERSQAAWQETQRQLEETAKEALDRQATLKGLQEDMDGFVEAYRSQEAASKAHKDDLEDLLAESQKLDSALKDMQSFIQIQEKEMQTSQRSYDQLALRIAAYEDTLSDHYDMSLEEALAEADMDLDTDQAAKRIRSLRAKKQALGELNFTAPEDFAALQERVTFLSTQLDDLQEGKRKLEKVIAEMEETMTGRFKATFDQVNAQFQRIFIEMFEGGNAELSLSMPEDLLETGIEIIAKPPGKKASVLSLLSGGERAMTAIALLFALQEARPSPFVVLDEIEAALDEANIQRFTKFLKRYAQDTQFIIISHRRGTIAAAQVLYGVTMDKSGVSSQVSVRFTEQGVMV